MCNLTWSRAGSFDFKVIEMKEKYTITTSRIIIFYFFIRKWNNDILLWQRRAWRPFQRNKNILRQYYLTTIRYGKLLHPGNVPNRSD